MPALLAALAQEGVAGPWRDVSMPTVRTADNHSAFRFGRRLHEPVCLAAKIQLATRAICLPHGDRLFVNSEYSPWEYFPYRINIESLAQPSKRSTRRQIQPGSGAEKAFGDALREIREKKAISQERLALESGLDRTYISLIE